MEAPTGELPPPSRFFKPLRPEFRQGILIPVHFSQFLSLSNKGDEAKLRTNLGEWKVKIKSGYLRGGWLDFAKCHGLNAGDVLVFKHEGDLVFRVLVLGPNTCERSYAVPEEETPHVNDSSRSKRKYNISSRACSKEGASSPCLVTMIQPRTRNSEFIIPTRFARSHGLDKQRCEVLIVDADHAERTWKVKLSGIRRRNVALTSGWSDFRTANELKAGDAFSLELLHKGTNPVMLFRRMSRTAEVTEKPKKLVSLSPPHFVYTLSQTSVEHHAMHLQKAQIESSGLSMEDKVTIKDPKRRNWHVSLCYGGRGSYRLRGGWNDVVVANKLKAGDVIKLQAVRRGEAVTMNLSFCNRSARRLLLKDKLPKAYQGL